jgi:hypothetical protein
LNEETLNLSLGSNVAITLGKEKIELKFAKGVIEIKDEMITMNNSNNRYRLGEFQFDVTSIKNSQGVLKFMGNAMTIVK